MEEKKNNKKKIIIIVGILILVSVIGGTLAYFMARATSSEQTITSANLKIVFDDSTPIINATDIEPIEEEDILTNAAKKTFRISKESNTVKDLYARIDMIDLNISDNFKDYDLKWALYEGTNKITTGTFVPTLDGSTSINMATNVLLNSTTPKEYNLYIWINETGLEQISLMDGSLKGKISVTAEAKKLNTLASNILSETVKNNSNVNKWETLIYENQSEGNTSSSNKTISTSYTFDSTTGYYTLSGTILENVSYDTSYINYYTCDGKVKICRFLYQIKEVDGTEMITSNEFDVRPNTEDKGLYVQKDDNEKSEFGFPTYYYRGAVENNYVQLGTYKNDVTNKVYGGSTGGSKDTVVANTNDPILWRIVRINEDGSIKIISEYNTGSNIIYNSTSDSKYIKNDGTNSMAKDSVENWYTSTITENNIKDKIQIGSFCNDITMYNSIYYSTYRIDNLLPIFKCPNGALVANEKVGMISADEINYAGGSSYNTNSDNMTYMSNHTDFWTMTPWNDFKVYTWINNSKILNNNIPGVPAFSTRPVINLKSDILINGGIGTKQDPYIIE